jgi:hypothetical protein
MGNIAPVVILFGFLVSGTVLFAISLCVLIWRIQK